MNRVLSLLIVSGALASAAPVVDANYTCSLYEAGELRYTGGPSDPTCANHIPGMSVTVASLEYFFLAEEVEDLFQFTGSMQMHMAFNCTQNCDIYDAMADMDVSITETQSVLLSGKGKARIRTPPLEYISRYDDAVPIHWDISYPPIFNRRRPFDVHMSLYSSGRLHVGSQYIAGQTVQIFAVDDANHAPEPGTLGIAALGLAGLVYMRRKHSSCSADLPIEDLASRSPELERHS